MKPLNLGRPLAAGDYVEVSEMAAAELGLTVRGPYRVVRIEEQPDNMFIWRVAVGVDLPHGQYWVFEDHVIAVEPPRMTLLEKELAARQPWQDRRDENLRNVFGRERL